ncbi:MAG: chromate transporter [Planctomycetes bacterium B3_Pla]|nr:MAG: chromate transporter [Planctomycetes bacterium B3_Pla]
MTSTLFRLSWVFLKIGTVSFGGGVVIIPMVETEVVNNYGWLTKAEFIDAITLGQVTPGPVIISATFIGYKACGILGAIVATASVILPSFVMICLATAAIKKFRENRILANFLRGARVAVIGLVFDAGVSIGRSSVIDLKTILIVATTIVCLFKYNVNPIWILLGAGIVGLAWGG